MAVGVSILVSKVRALRKGNEAPRQSANRKMLSRSEYVEFGRTPETRVLCTEVLEAFRNSAKN